MTEHRVPRAGENGGQLAPDQGSHDRMSPSARIWAIALIIVYVVLGWNWLREVHLGPCVMIWCFVEWLDTSRIFKKMIRRRAGLGLLRSFPFHSPGQGG
jgi:hypothetical protein